MEQHGLLIDTKEMPAHVAIILDGNGRWAKKQGKKRSFGHIKGAANVKHIVRAANDYGIQVLTLYVFSTENMKRSAVEVQVLMKLFLEYFLEYGDELKQNNVRACVIGCRDQLNRPLQKAISKFEEATSHCTGMKLNIALQYGGRTEIVQAAQRLLNEQQSLSAVELTESLFEKYLYESSAIDVDLMIRTGGEYRISNFLLWQSAYAELYFTDILWPDFTREDFIEAILSYQRRERRFGGVDDGE